MPSHSPFKAAIAEEIWRSKYRFVRPDGSAEETLDDTLMRVARAAAGAEKGGKRARERWASTFHGAMSDLGFIPAGRILAGAGTARAVTLFNCFVMGTIEDDLGSIFDGVKQAALTMQAGGGVGMDFSTLRPAGAPVRSIGADASGPVSFMHVWDAMCRTIMSAGARRGAMMATMRADHPDIEMFVDAKREAGQLRNFNLSVLVSDAFIDAVRSDAEWPLVFGGKVHRTISARALWRRIMSATYEYAEPGVIFIDRVNGANNLRYCETISATNPCGEQPLPPFGACLLGSINVAALVEKPFEADAHIDLARLEERVGIAVRLLDNIIDVSRYPLPRQRQEAFSKRRIGLGVTGLADALAFVGLRYDSAEARHMAGRWMEVIAESAYRASAGLAAEKGAFPLYDRDAFLAAPFVLRLSETTRAEIARHGIRNGCLTSVAPTGTISLLAGNVSSGIEPIFDYRYRRNVLDKTAARRQETVEDHAFAEFRRRFGEDAPLPPAFVTARELAPSAHLAMQAALQPHVDSSISKTINVPADCSFEEFEAIYLEADALGLKGCTTYRPNAVTGAVLEAGAGGALPTDAAVGPSHAASAPAVAEPPFTGKAAAGVGENVVAASARGVARDVPRALVPHGQREVVYISHPLERDAVLQGFTYKLRWPSSDHAIYVTINDIERGGRRRPFEIFINTRNLDHYAWTVALTRMISAVFRRGGDVSFVAEELKAVFDPQGGQWLEGRYVPSLLAAIGDVIQRHLVEIGFNTPEMGSGADMGPVSVEVVAGREAEAGAVRAAASVLTGGASSSASASTSTSTRINSSTGAKGKGGGTGQHRSGEKDSIGDATRRPPPAHFCPRCSSARLERQEGCSICRDCGFSKCD